MLCTFYMLCKYAVYLLYVLGYNLYVPCERMVSTECTTICCFGSKVVRLFYIVRPFVNIIWPRLFIMWGGGRQVCGIIHKIALGVCTVNFLNAHILQNMVIVCFLHHVHDIFSYLATKQSIYWATSITNP